MQRSPDERFWSGLAHLGYLLGGMGLLIAFVIYFVQRERSYFVANHARQAIGFQLAVMVSRWLLAILGLGSFGLLRPVFPGRFGLALIAFAFYVALAVLAVVAAVNAFRGRHYRYPLIGDWIPEE